MTLFNRNRNHDEGPQQATAPGTYRGGEAAQAGRAFFNANAARARSMPPQPQPQPPFSLSFNAYTQPPVPTAAPVLPGSSAAEPVPGPSTTAMPPPQPSTGMPQDQIQSDPATDEKELIVKRGVTLKGEISSCDRVLIRGTVEALLIECGRLDVFDTGIFKGCANVKEAAIAGRVEGAIVVDGMLTVLPGSEIHATVHYGKLRVEEGATIAGELKNITSSEIKHEPARYPSDATSPDSIETRPDVAAE